MQVIKKKSFNDSVQWLQCYVNQDAAFQWLKIQCIEGNICLNQKADLI